jgi:heptosyltransferase-2
LVDGVISKDCKSIKFIIREKFDKAILFSESPSSLISAFISGIKERTGFNTASLSFLLTNKVQRIGPPSLFNNRKLGFAMGFCTIQDDYTNILNIPEENLNNVKDWFKYNNFAASKTIAISVGASKRRQNKCLEESKWVAIIDILHDKGFNCVLLGVELEKEMLNAIAQKCRILPKLFVTDNRILDNAAFLKNCNLFIGIDSGAMHLAAAVGTRCIGVFGHTDPIQIGPMPLEKHVIIKKDDISQITPEEVVKRII